MHSPSFFLYFFADVGGLLPRSLSVHSERLPDDADLNSLTSFGIYSGGYCSKLINGPAEAPQTIYMLIVFGYSEIRVTQLIASANGFIRSRVYLGEQNPAWSAWS